ncbi:OmpL47-type beta-barrel domain-containing protein, partial [Paenibacillus alvei]
MRALINKCTSFICSFVLLIGFIIQPFGMRVANAAAPQTVSKSIYLRTTVGQENEVGKFDLWELIPPSMRYKDGLKIHRITIKGSQNSYATLGHGGGDGYMIGIWSYSKLSFNGQTENLVFTSTGGSKGDWNSGNVPSKEQVNEEYRDITLDGKSEFQLFLSGEKISFYPDTASSTLDVKVEIEFTPPNLSPILEVEQYDRVGSYFVHLDGKVSDPDQDELNIEVDFAGHPFGMTIHPGESNWFMSLPVDRVPEGVYSNIPVTANDHKSPPVTVMYKGKITIDRTPPTAPKIILSTDKWSSQPIKVNIIPGVDALSGVARTEYKLSGNATQNWSRNDGEDIVIQSEGVIHIAARTIDRAGNISNEVTSSVYVDKSQPTSPVFTANHNGWSNNNVTVSLEDGKSSFSPLKQSEYSIDGQPWQIYQLPIEIKKEGITRISGRTINQVGHVSPESSITVNIDRTPPTSPKLQPSITGWTNQDVLVSLKHGDDALSGIRNSEFNIDGQGWVNYSSPIQITKEGSTRVSARTIDQAGNIGPVTEITVSIDKSAPAISINPINRTWDSTDIPAEIRYSDSLSGVDPNSRKYAVTNSPVPPANWNTATADVQHITITNEGEWYVHAAVADKAGNIKNVSSQSLQLQSIPQEPANFRVTSVEGETVHLAWDLPAGNVLADGYEYNIGNLTTGRSWTVAYPGHTLQDQNVEAGKTYEYRITVKNHVGSSAYTVPVSALTLPAAVKGLSVSPIGREAFAG